MWLRGECGRWRGPCATSGAIHARIGVATRSPPRRGAHEPRPIRTDREVAPVDGRPSRPSSVRPWVIPRIHPWEDVNSQHGLVYKQLLSTFGRKRAQQYADANEAAISEIETRIDELDVDAGFERTSAYVYAESEADVQGLREEAAAARQLGLPATGTDSIQAPIDVAGALRFDNQAQFHPRKYLLAIAERIDETGGDVFETTRAIDLDAGSPCRVETNRGTVIADDVVLATLFPFTDPAGYFARIHPSRTYLLAVELTDAPPDGMYLSSGLPPSTFRPYPSENRDVLIVGGQSHAPRRNGSRSAERYRRCEAFARKHFSVESVLYRWSAHDYVPIDGVPFIGQLGPMTDSVYVGTGFNKWGMTGGTAAGMILSDLIVNGSNPWADVFDPIRFTASLSAGSKFVSENMKIGSRWLSDRAQRWLSFSDIESELPKRGDGTIIRRYGRPIAVHRDESGELHAVSATCPHMWCIVDWNAADQTWDCPCHGSRFAGDGTMKYGPAVEDLEPRQL